MTLSDISKRIDDELRQLDSDSEYEIIFGSLERPHSLLVFKNILGWVKQKKESIPGSSFRSSKTMDFSYKGIRITVNGEKAINQTIIATSSSNISRAFQILTDGENPDVQIMFKDKKTHAATNINATEYGFRTRRAIERTPTKSELEGVRRITNDSDVMIRLKNRISLIVVDDDELTVRLDITSVQSDKRVSKVASVPAMYEIELEVFKKTNSKTSSDKRKIILALFRDILQHLNGDIAADATTDATTDAANDATTDAANYGKNANDATNAAVLSAQDKADVLATYGRLLRLTVSASMKLVSMQPISIMIKAFLNELPNRYSVTDKADGSKVAVIITQGRMYLCSTNMNVTLFRFDRFDEKALSKYNDTILEAELVKSRVLCYDALVVCGEDIRSSRTTTRLERLKEVVLAIHPGAFRHEKKVERFDRYEAECRLLCQQYVKHINDHKHTFEMKLFFNPTGIEPCEIYKYSWLIYSEFKSIDYCLDGLIYTGLNQPYTNRTTDVVEPTYKWKPENMNSLDVYLVLMRDRNNRPVRVTDAQTSNGTYRVGTINVGSAGSAANGRERNHRVQSSSAPTGELYVPFLDGSEYSQIYIAEKDGMIYDMEGDVVQDNSVIEIVYRNDPTLPIPWRWQIMRTRYDKTEQVRLHQRQYGNYDDVSRRIWQTIQNPVRWDDIVAMGSGSVEQYSLALSTMMTRLSLQDSKTVDVVEETSKYYQKRKKLAESLNKYHNFIKSLLMYQYFGEKPTSISADGTIRREKMAMLDCGVGEGGDIMKMYHCKVKSLVGIDKSSFGLTCVNGAVNRYSDGKKRYPGFPPMEFIHADFGELLDEQHQRDSLNGINELNLKKIGRYFRPTQNSVSRKFDGINCQFMLHYCVGTDDAVSNVCDNINQTLVEGGYMIVTMFDGDLVDEYLGEKESRTTEYVDSEGTRQTYFSIRRPVTAETAATAATAATATATAATAAAITNPAIELHYPEFMADGEWKTEYLVHPKQLIQTFKDRCQLRLVESMRFRDLIELQRPFFEEVVPTTTDKKLHDFFNKAREYYTISESDSPLHIDRAALTMTSLNRYYVFRKM
jgi:hypothetical protein